MKRLFIVISIFIFCCCSTNDNDSDVNENNILIGSWYLVSWELDGQPQNLDSCNLMSYIMFNSNSSFSRIWYETVSGDCIIEGNDTGSFVYSLENNSITLEFEDVNDGAQTELFNVLELTNFTLQFSLTEEGLYSHTFEFIKN